MSCGCCQQTVYVGYDQKDQKEDEKDNSRDPDGSNGSNGDECEETSSPTLRSGFRSGLERSGKDSKRCKDESGNEVIYGGSGPVSRPPVSTTRELVEEPPAKVAKTGDPVTPAGQLEATEDPTATLPSTSPGEPVRSVTYPLPYMPRSVPLNHSSNPLIPDGTGFNPNFEPLEITPSLDAIFEPRGSSLDEILSAETDITEMYMGSIAPLPRWNTDLAPVNSSTPLQYDREVRESVRSILNPPPIFIGPNPSTVYWTCRRGIRLPAPPPFQPPPEEILGEPTFEQLNSPINQPPCATCPKTIEETIVANTEYEEEFAPEFQKPEGGIAPAPTPAPAPAPAPAPTPNPNCVPYEPPIYGLDTRVEPNLEIPFDYLWGLELGFPFNWYNRLHFDRFTTTDIPATRKPANLVFYAYRPDGWGSSRWDAISVTGLPESPVPPNPEPGHYTDAHWTYIFQTKWRYVNQTANYGIERYATKPYPSDTHQSYAAQQVKEPMTGYIVNAVDPIGTLTTKYESTIHYKSQFTLEEAKETAYMWYFKDSKYLPSSIQTATSGSELHPAFSAWSPSDVTSFKEWAATKSETVNKYYSGPAVQGTCESSPGSPGGVNPPVEGNQYTPNHTFTTWSTEEEMINEITAVSQASPHIFSQDPDGHSHVLPWMWDLGTWDGTPVDPSSMTQSELCVWLKPVQTENHYVIRGIRELFYEVKPFVDNEAPTPREIDLWNIEVVRHFRRMLGISTPANLDARLELEARWASERKWTQDWDAAYPLDCDGNNTKGGPCGPCWDGGTAVDTAGGHCGAAFFPNAGDRAPYLASQPYLNDVSKYPELDNYTVRRGASEGTSAIGVEVPWSLKLAMIIANWICDEGLTGHPGPYVNPVNARETMGFDWWWNGTGGVAFRGKYK